MSEILVVCMWFVLLIVCLSGLRVGLLVCVMIVLCCFLFENVFAFV